MIVLAIFVPRFLVGFPANTPISENLTILRCVMSLENMAYEKHESLEEFIVDWIAYKGSIADWIACIKHR